MLAKSTESLNSKKVIMCTVRNIVYFVPSLLQDRGTLEKNND